MYQQDSREVSSKILQDSCEVVRKSLGDNVDQQYSCDVSWKSLDSSRIAVKSLGRVWIPEG